MDTGFIAAEEKSLAASGPSESVIDDASDLLWRSRTIDPGDSWDSEYGAVGLRLNSAAAMKHTFFIDGVKHQGEYQNNHPVIGYGPQIDGGFVVFYRGDAYEVSRHSPRGASGGPASDGSLRAPMPGKIVAAPAVAGDTVAKGAPIVVLEAMKMEHALVAPFDGVVESVAVAVGEQVGEGVVLAVVTPAEGNP